VLSEELFDRTKAEKYYCSKIKRSTIIGYSWLSFYLLLAIYLMFEFLKEAWNSNFFSLEFLLSLIFSYFIQHSIYIAFTKPKGVFIRKSVAPKLFHVVNELCQQLNCSPLKYIFLTKEANIYLGQRPAFGFLGTPHSTLEIGYIALASLTVDELRALIAAEIAHVAKSERRLIFADTYLTGLTWTKIADKLTNAKKTFVMSPIFIYYSKDYFVQSYLAARQDIKFSDAQAINIVSESSFASGLIRLCAVKRYYDQYFSNECMRFVFQHERIPSNYLELQLSYCYGALPDYYIKKEARTLFNEKLELENYPYIPIVERLKDQGISLNQAQIEQIISTPPSSSSAAFLGLEWDVLLLQLNKIYRKSTQRKWKKLHRNLLKNHDKLTQYEKRIARGNIIGSNEWADYAMLVSNFYSYEKAVSVYRDFLKMHSSDGVCASGLARVLERLDDPDCVTQAQIALDTGDIIYSDAAKVIISHLKSHGLYEKAKVYEKELADLLQKQSEAKHQWREYGLMGIFSLPNFPESQMAQLRTQLDNVDNICAAYLIRYANSFDSTKPPCYLLIKPYEDGVIPKEIICMKIVTQINQFIKEKDGIKLIVISEFSSLSEKIIEIHAEKIPGLLFYSREKMAPNKLA
jgi:hypothetical protein